MVTRDHRDRDCGESGDFRIGFLIRRRFNRGDQPTEVLCEVIDPFSDEYDALLRDAPFFRKAAEVRVRNTIPGEVICTDQASTRRVAEHGDVVVENPTGETYVITASDLAIRYDPKPGTPGIYIAKGIVRAVSLYKPVLMKASWGEWLGAMAGDMLAERTDTGERYCIERAAFEATFVPHNTVSKE